MTLIVELFAHMDAGNRRIWLASQDIRPLSELGRHQAQSLCARLATSQIDALYSSPALRCIESIEPLATRFGVEVRTLDELRETDGWAPPPPWRNRFDDIAEAVSGAFAAGRAMRALRLIKDRQPTGRVAVCTHGDVLPAAVAYLIGVNGQALPPSNTTRGGWYTIHLDDAQAQVEHHGVLPGFPL